MTILQALQNDVPSQRAFLAASVGPLPPVVEEPVYFDGIVAHAALTTASAGAARLAYDPEQHASHWLDIARAALALHLHALEEHHVEPADPPD